MNNRIRCSVNNCTHWSKGNECSADWIMVTSDSNTGSTQDASLLSSAGTPAEHSAETCCNTFKDKDSGLAGSYHGSGAKM
ncbi:MAG: hypothetical protein BWY85_02433 [Firmicutes bacterium ADurb.Bin506]|nr:MAG: hypothetical protein BWY85_02433 [Firmicutes bacterium ADurb.Bin506]